jgi:hypothetical protein
MKKVHQNTINPFPPPTSDQQPNKGAKDSTYQTAPSATPTTSSMITTPTYIVPNLKNKKKSFITPSNH